MSACRGTDQRPSVLIVAIMAGGRLRVAGAVAVACALAACSGSTGAPKPTRTVTVTVPPSTPVTTPASTSPAPTPTTSAPPAHLTKLRGRCDSRLPLLAIDNAINRDLGGKTEFVVGVPEKDIKRIGYINCRYGVTSANGTPAVEIGVSLYQTPAAAQARIAPTVEDYQNHGASASDVQVSGRPAKVLTGGSGAGYTAATLVLADGQRTIAVSVADPIPAAKRTDALKALAALADRRTAG
jgi:hypothetical protein